MEQDGVPSFVGMVIGAVVVGVMVVAGIVLLAVFSLL
jgi:outer membrane murein-binding lipoprotein Lpp